MAALIRYKAFMSACRIGIAIVVAAAALGTGCTSVPHRAAPASYDCMKTVRDALPPGLPDKRAHCLAAGRIAQQCSVIEADIAGLGKEVLDVFNHGDPSWADWRADRAGIRCARKSGADEELGSCCQAAGY